MEAAFRYVSADAHGKSARTEDGKTPPSRAGDGNAFRAEAATAAALIRKRRRSITATSYWIVT
jgi:hypothetical protein